MIFVALGLALVFVCGMLAGGVWLVDQDWFIHLFWSDVFKKDDELAQVPGPQQVEIPEIGFRKASDSHNV